MNRLKHQLLNRSFNHMDVDSIGRGERLLGYAVAGISASAGAGLLIGAFADDLIVGLGMAGVGLSVSAIMLISTLREKTSDAKQTISQDTELIKSLSDNSDFPEVITNFSGEMVAANTAYSLLGAERRRPIASLLDMEDGDIGVAKLIESVLEHGSNIETFPATRDEQGDLHVESTKVGMHIIWRLRPQNIKARTQAIIHDIQKNIEPILFDMHLGLALIDVDGNFLYANAMLRQWLQLPDGQAIPSRLRLKDHNTRLVGDNDIVHDVQVSKCAVEVGEGESEFGEVIVLRNLEGYAGSRTKNTLGDDIIDPLIDAAPIGVVVVDQFGAIEDVNQRMVLFGQSLGSPDYKNIFDIISDEYHSEFQKLLDRVSTGQVVRRPHEVRFIGKGEKIGQFYFSTIKTEDKRFIILYMIDTSQQKLIEKQFVQAQKMQAVGQLAGGVAHDFNNLLTAIIGFCDLSLARHDASDTTFSDLMNIKQNANRASNLVRQLLAFSRQQTLRPTVLSISDVIAELSNLVRRLIGENITLEIKHGRDLSLVKVDQGQLEQVIINLAVNAKDAMPNGGELRITTRTLKSTDSLFDKYDVIVPGDYVLVELQDTGTGISEEHASQIFEPFFTTKDVGKGTGLGLATVYGIVKQTGGYVFFDSVVGKGTTFMIFLKSHTSEEGIDVVENKMEAAPPQDLTGHGTILLVEDEDAVRLFTMRALSNKGYTVIEASCGEDGLELYTEHAKEIDLVITDVIMPGMDGPTLVKNAKKINNQIKVIFMSGYAEDVVRKDLEDDTCYFLPKPFSLNELAETVKKVLF